ncbi:hypothetical protein HaLaN_25357, partial [Haematococcus lacustris]
AVRLAAGFTLHDCEVGGWVIQPPACLSRNDCLAALAVQEGSNNFWKLWDMYNLQDGLGGIYWPAVWQ